MLMPDDAVNTQDTRPAVAPRVGWEYETREGKTVRIVRNDGDSHYPFHSDTEEVYESCGHWDWKEGKQFIKFDLIREIGTFELHGYEWTDKPKDEGVYWIWDGDHIWNRPVVIAESKLLQFRTPHAVEILESMKFFPYTPVKPFPPVIEPELEWTVKTVDSHFLDQVPEFRKNGIAMTWASVKDILNGKDTKTDD